MPDFQQTLDAAAELTKFSAVITRPCGVTATHRAVPSTAFGTGGAAGGLLPVDCDAETCSGLPIRKQSGVVRWYCDVP